MGTTSQSKPLPVRAPRRLRPPDPEGARLLGLLLPALLGALLLLALSLAALR